jgi:nicotinamidase-related amidase
VLLPERQPARSPSLLDAGRSLLLVIDAQEGFRKAIPAMDAVGDRIALLVRAAARLGVPAIATEQYPKALGHTLSPIRESLAQGSPVLEKLAFSACDLPAWTAAVKDSGRDQLILCGVEAHVCVLQTALDLASRADASIYVAADAVSSRREEDRASALHRMETHGVQIVTAEMVVFEWLRHAGTSEFKEVQGWIK